MDNLLITALAASLRTPGDDERECKLTEVEAIGRLCSLMNEVREHLDGPADCFCPGTFRDPTGYRNDGKAIEFIETAVRTALDSTAGSTK
jgi:hypothetical protein